MRDPDPSFAELAGEAWDAATNLDGRVLTTLRQLMLRPGRLTAEYLSGRRTRYLPPLRLYLLCSVGYFLVASVAPDRSEQRNLFAERARRDSVATAARKLATADSMRQVLEPRRRTRLLEHGIALPAGPLDSSMIRRSDSIAIAMRVAGWRVVPRAIKPRLVRGQVGMIFDRQRPLNFVAMMPRLMFVLMPVLGVLLAVSYRSRRRRYPVHLVVALHLHAFVFAILTIDVASNVIPTRGLRYLVGIPLVLWTLSYFPRALREVYGGRFRYAIPRVIVLLAAYLLVMLILLVSVQTWQWFA